MLYTGTGCVSVFLGVYAVFAPPEVNRTHAHLVGSMHPSSQSQHTKKSSSRFIFTSTKERVRVSVKCCCGWSGRVCCTSVGETIPYVGELLRLLCGVMIDTLH